MAYESVFKRYEKKYTVDAFTRKKLLDVMDTFMMPDEYPQSVICNIYYDNAENTLIRRSLDKPTFKEKFRMRCYCVPLDDTTTFLEIKRKYNGIVYKRRVGLKYSDAVAFMNENILPDMSQMNFSDRQIVKEISYFKDVYDPVPYAFVGYDRLALVSKTDPLLRITFDDCIRSRNTDLELKSGDYGQFLLDNGVSLMEIKACNAYPMWLTKLLSENKLYPTSFSKIGECYKDYNSTYEGVNEPCLIAY